MDIPIHGSLSPHYKCESSESISLCAECLAVFVGAFLDDETAWIFFRFFQLQETTVADDNLRSFIEQYSGSDRHAAESGAVVDIPLNTGSSHSRSSRLD